MDSVTGLSTDQKLDFLITTVLSMKQSVSKIDDLVTKVSTLEAKNKALEASVETLSAEVKTLKEQSNSWDQQARSNTVRLFNFPGSNDEVNLANRVYDRILKPIFAAAKANGEIATLPQVGTAVEEVFRAGRFAAGPNKPPPPIIIKFSSPSLRLAILKNKRRHIPPPTEGEKASGTKRFTITEDLTAPTYKKFQEILHDDRVARAWTHNGTIWFVPVGDNKPAVRVKSVYDPLSEIIK